MRDRREPVLVRSAQRNTVVTQPGKPRRRVMAAVIEIPPPSVPTTGDPLKELRTLATATCPLAKEVVSPPKQRPQISSSRYPSGPQVFRRPGSSTPVADGGAQSHGSQERSPGIESRNRAHLVIARLHRVRSIGYSSFENEPLGRQGTMAMTEPACSQPRVRVRQDPMYCATVE
jgi:hypothetical protein